MRKLTFLLALCLSFLCHLTAQAVQDTNYLWWLTIGGDKVTDWTCVDNVGTFVNINPSSPNYKKVRTGRDGYYFEATEDYHHVYINEIKLVFHTKDNVQCDPAYSSWGTVDFKSGVVIKYEINENANVAYSDANTGKAQIIRDGDEISIKSIRYYLHVWVFEPNGTTYRSGLTYTGSVADWTNITHSTSEYYKNYLNNDFIAENRTPNYFEVDEHGDGTYLLHPGWLCDTHTTYNEYYDGHNRVIDRNWTGESGTVIDMHDNYAGKYGGWQEITLDHNGDYTVQAIVRGPAGGKVKLRLSSDGNTSESEQDVYGKDDNSPSTVNTFGRVDYWDMGTNAGWTKVETTLSGVVANKKLKIELLSDAAFEVSDVTLLKDANKDDVSFWTTAGLNENTTSKEMLATKVITHHLQLYNEDVEIHFPYYNKFSFFDRGTNKNGVVYAHPKTVIGMPAGMADDQDHAHECNVAVPYYDMSGIYGTGAENNVENETNITCKKLILSDNGTNNTSPHSFGIPKAIKAKEVSYERQYKAGQMSTAVFPFALTAEQLSDFFGVEKVHIFKSIDVENQTLTFEDKTSTVANEPFMFKPTKAGKITIVASGEDYIDVSNTLDPTTKEPLEIATVGTNANGGTATFQGIYKQKIWGADYITNENNNPVYMFNAAKASGQFSILAGGKTARCKPFRAYMEVTKDIVGSLNITRPSAYKVIYIDGTDNGLTGINGIVDNVAPTVKAIYTIDGRYVGTDVNVLERGIYIINGKKVIIK